MIVRRRRSNRAAFIFLRMRERDSRSDDMNGLPAQTSVTLGIIFWLIGLTSECVLPNRSKANGEELDRHGRHRGKPNSI